MRLGELATHSRVTQPTMTKIIANLNELEWIKRIADSSDARAWHIAITTKGQAALDDWRARLGSALEPLFSDLSAADRDVLANAITLLEARLDVRSEAA